MKLLYQEIKVPMESNMSKFFDQSSLMYNTHNKAVPNILTPKYNFLLLSVLFILIRKEKIMYLSSEDKFDSPKSTKKKLQFL